LVKGKSTTGTEQQNMTSVDELEMEELKRDTEGGAAVRVQATHSFLFINHFVKKCANIEQNVTSFNSRFWHELTSTVLLWW
jgi:hypothetical protein